MSTMRICVPVTVDGQVGARWGRADRVALADVSGGRITGWQEVEVGWDVLHDQGGEGGHHARVARFLIDHEVRAVIADHMGPPMRIMLDKMGLRVLPPTSPDARTAVLAAAE